MAVDLSRERNVHTAERDRLIFLATAEIDEAFYEVLDNDRSRLLETAGGFRRAANMYLGFVLSVGLGLILLVRFMLRVSRREGDALAARELVISRQEEFIGLVSHELRTPITSILGYSQVLNGHLSEFSSEEVDEMIGTIADQADHVAGLVDDLLTLFRVDAGHLRLEIEEFCVVDVVR